MHPRRSYYYLAVFLLPFLVILQDSRIKEPIHGISLTLLKPAFLLGNAVTEIFTNTGEGMDRFWKAFHRQGVDERRIAELELELRQFQETVKENERLKKILEFRDTLGGKKIAARVIGRDPSPWRRTLILDKGTRQGITKDMVVLVPEGLVGRILEAGPSTSRAILLTDVDSRVGGMADDSRAQGMIGGTGESTLVMDYLELESKVAVGENVTSSGLSGIFPKGIRIGKITSLSRDTTSLHLQAKVDSYVRFSKLEEVLCLAPSPEK